MNRNLSVIVSDYEQHSNASATERDILASVLHVADKFCQIPAMGDSDGGDQLLGVGSPLRPATLKDIRTLGDISAIVERVADARILAATSTTTPVGVNDKRQNDGDAAIVDEMMQEILLRVSGAGSAQLDMADEVIDDLFVTRIVHEASQSIVSIPRSVGVHDLLLESSKARLQGLSTHAIETPIEPIVPAETQAEYIDRIVAETTRTAESVTEIIDYDSLGSLAPECGKLHRDLSGLRSESVCSAQSVSLAGLASRKSVQSSGKGTWSRIKKVFSSMSGRSTLNIPN